MAEEFSIPGFQLDLTLQQKDLCKTLKQNGFRFEMNNNSAKTVRIKKDRKYGYINGDVNRYRGVMGYTFTPRYIDASPFETQNETLEWFNSNYPGSRDKIAFHSIPSRNPHYLIILDVDLALKVCGVSSKTGAKISGEKCKVGGCYKQVQTECIKCFQKIGVAAEFTKDGNIIRCMKEKASADWPEDWFDYVVKNAGDIIKGVEIKK